MSNAEAILRPIRNVNVYLLLRGKSGSARFDDFFLAEKPQALFPCRREDK